MPKGRPASKTHSEGGEAFTNMVADVNFPAFVGGLIDGVFNSIVTVRFNEGPIKGNGRRVIFVSGITRNQRLS